MEALTGTKTLIWPGIDIDIPTGPNHSKSTPRRHRGTRCGRVAGGRARRAALAQILRDEAGEPARRRRCNQGAEARMTRRTLFSLPAVPVLASRGVSSPRAQLVVPRRPIPRILAVPAELPGSPRGRRL